jgi:hypothetical protein
MSLTDTVDLPPYYVTYSLCDSGEEGQHLFTIKETDVLLHKPDDWMTI